VQSMVGASDAIQYGRPRRWFSWSETSSPSKGGVSGEFHAVWLLAVLTHCLAPLTPGQNTLCDPCLVGPPQHHLVTPSSRLNLNLMFGFLGQVQPNHWSPIYTGCHLLPLQTSLLQEYNYLIPSIIFRPTQMPGTEPLFKTSHSPHDYGWVWAGLPTDSTTLP